MNSSPLRRAPIFCWSALTLVEVLVVISVIAILASLSMPVVMIASRAAKQTATRSVMHKAETALHLFHAEIGSFPFQRNYADTSLGVMPENRLFFHVGTTLAPADLLKLHQDADAAASQYAYDCFTGVSSPPAEQAPVSPHVFRVSDCKPAPSTTGDEPAWRYNKFTFAWEPLVGSPQECLATCVMLNRMGAERARLAIWSGNIDVMGCRIRAAYAPTGALYASGRDNSTLALIRSPAIKQTTAKPGWAADYLGGELESRYVSGEVINDAWGHPLVYVCQVVEGMQGTRGSIFDVGLRWIDARQYGLERQGRKTLASVDPNTGAAIVADVVTLPDTTDLLNSDRRIWAAPGREGTFELWSAGPDGRFDWMRRNAVNQDNIGLEVYDREIVP